MRNVGPESSKSYQRRQATGFFDKYLGGPDILDIGYQGGDPNSVPIVDHAIGIDRDYPGYDGIHLPFPNDSQDAIFSSHCYEHIGDYRSALCDWYRVLRIGGYIVVIVPHKYLYERKSTIPSFFNPDHKRFYTPAALLREFEESLPVNGFRVRHLADNDAEFDYATPIGEHAVGCYEIELVVQKIARLPQSELFELSPKRQTYIDHVNRVGIEIVRRLIGQQMSAAAAKDIVQKLIYFPAYEIIRRVAVDQEKIIDEHRLRVILKQILDAVQIDMHYYKEKNPDVEAAVASGQVESAGAHFAEHGYFEGRVFQKDPAILPLPVRV